MKKRVKLFLVGFIIGIIVVIFTYGEKTSSMFSWTPEGRVLKRLRLTEKVISDSMQCILDCNQFDEDDWNAMYKIGDVNFSKARTKPYPIYIVSMENDSIAYSKLSFLAKDEVSVLIDYQGPISICDCP